MCWLRVADDCFPASNFTSSWNLGSSQSGELAALQMDVRKYLARKPGWSRLVIGASHLTSLCLYNESKEDPSISAHMMFFVLPIDQTFQENLTDFIKACCIMLVSKLMISNSLIFFFLAILRISLTSARIRSSLCFLHLAFSSLLKLHLLIRSFILMQ